MEVNYKSIGQRIKKFRLEQGLTQEQLSELADLTPTHTSHIETGNTKVSLPTLLQIAQSLQVTLDDLVFDSIPHTKHVSLKEMDRLMTDCTDDEAKALVSIAAAAKSAIRTLK